MTLADIFGTIECHAEVILRVFSDVDKYEDVTATWDNIYSLRDLSIICLVPHEGQLIVELA